MGFAWGWGGEWVLDPPQPAILRLWRWDDALELELELAGGGTAEGAAFGFVLRRPNMERTSFSCVGDQEKPTTSRCSFENQLV